MHIDRDSAGLWFLWIMAVGGPTCVFLLLEIGVGIKRTCRMPVLLCLTFLALLAFPDTPFWLAGIAHLPEFQKPRFNADIFLQPSPQNLEFCDLDNDSNCAVLFQVIEDERGAVALVHIGSEIPFAKAYTRGRGMEFMNSKGAIFIVQRCSESGIDKILLGEECDGEFDALPNAAQWCREAKRFHEIFDIWQWAVVVASVVLVCWGAAFTVKEKEKEKSE